ncbi:unnamed protein product [Cyclocybe aegerita]|uniref:Uncharacterized protein n=1 Tax=Cyclocybe aegerita TaxID=1973307 RepID=A0A8S0WKH2_CYCAE|nr:unnamed protein product [Cyclocybe aegerita]
MYTPTFGMGPPSTIPRPPSQQQQQPNHPQHHTPDHIHIHPHHPQRPQSQPQTPHHQHPHPPQVPGRPPSQAGPSHTPRSLQPPLPPVGLTAVGRIPQGQQPPHLAPRPPTAGSNAPAAGPGAGPAHPPAGPDPPSTSAASSIPRPPQMLNGMGVGSGAGLTRLLQFSGVLSAESNKTQKLQWAWWNELVKEYFTPKAVMKLTLWKDNQRNEAKPFEIGIPILPRFFLVTTQSGVKSMTLSLDGARERTFGQGHSVVECVAAVWTYKYTNGYTVTLRGPLTAHVIVAATQPPPSSTSGPSTSSNTQQPAYTLKFEEFQFDANFHDKCIALDAIQGNRTIEPPKGPMTPPSPLPPGASQADWDRRWEETRRWEEPRMTIEHASLPGEPVNAFGIPQATMRCLELAESVSAMAELIGFARETDLGPLDALKNFAQRIRESQHGLQPHLQHQQPGQPPQPNHQQQQHLVNGALTPFQSYPHTPSTLYSSASPSITHPAPPGPPSSMNSPQNTSSSSTNSPEKHPKSIPGQQQQGPPGSGPGPAPGQMQSHLQQHLQQQLQAQMQIPPPPPPGQGQGPSSSRGPTPLHTPLQNPMQNPMQQQAPTPGGPGAGGQGGPGQGGVSSPAVSSGGTHNTPAMSNASLKRKQVGGDAASPTMGPGGADGQGGQGAAGQPAKGAARQPRKRGRTGTTGAG